MACPYAVTGRLRCPRAIRHPEAPLYLRPAHCFSAALSASLHQVCAPAMTALLAHPSAAATPLFQRFVILSVRLSAARVSYLPPTRAPFVVLPLLSAMASGRRASYPTAQLTHALWYSVQLPVLCLLFQPCLGALLALLPHRLVFCRVFSLTGTNRPHTRCFSPTFGSPTVFLSTHGPRWHPVLATDGQSISSPGSLPGGLWLSVCGCALFNHGLHCTTLTQPFSPTLWACPGCSELACLIPRARLPRRPHPAGAVTALHCLMRRIQLYFQPHIRQERISGCFCLLFNRTVNTRTNR